MVNVTISSTFMGWVNDLSVWPVLWYFLRACYNTMQWKEHILNYTRIYFTTFFV